jgi:exonuclease SbcC
MKILSLRSENITPLKNFYINVRHENLVANVAIEETEIKVVDLMCLALFNKTPLLTDDGIHAMSAGNRMEKSKGKDFLHLFYQGSRDCKVVVEFLANDGKEYRSHWGFRILNEAEVNYREEYALWRIHDEQPITSNTRKKHLQQIEKLIGFNYEQFAQNKIW